MKNPLIRCVALLALLLGHIGLAGCAATQEKHCLLYTSDAADD